MPPLAPRCYFYGMGNVGLGLALALQARGWPILGAWNRGAARAETARQALHLSVAQSEIPPPPPHEAELIWITVSDDAISRVGRLLAASPHTDPHALPPVLVHTSGCLSADALAPWPGPRGSLHPLLACPTPERARDALPGAFFALEGDAAALPMLTQVVTALHGTHAVLHANAKPRYHAAAVLASNLMVALLDLAVHEAQEAGLGDAGAALTQFALGAVQHAQSLGTVRALTGPALRGDVQTLRAHVHALGPQALAAYRMLSLHAVSMAEQRDLCRSAADAARQLLDDSTP